MRWKYPDPLDAAEIVERSAVLKKIDAWWQNFQSKTADISALFKRKQSWDLADWMHQHLGAIDPRIMWEYGPGITSGGHRLVITPESTRELRPLVEVILGKAPDISGWEFYPYRPPETLEWAARTVAGRTKGDISRTSFKAEQGGHNRVDLTFFAPGYTGEDDRQAFNDCFVAIESLLGEEILDKWIGCIDIGQGSGNDTLPIDQLFANVRALIHKISGSLPANPCHEFSNSARWTLFEMEPEQASDYPRQDDMYVGRTMLKEMWQSAHSNDCFNSTRFSRNQEIFAYIKLDGTEGLSGEQFQDKSEIEDALDELLIPEKLGCVVGGGTGHRYSYIDLALLNVEKAVESIQSLLIKGGVPKRSWIQFFDTDLQNEWIGIWADSPPPPF